MKWLILLGLLLPVPSVLAQESPVAVSPTGDTLWYYQLGGGEPVLNFSEGADLTRFELFSGNAKWELSACHFDFQKSLNHYLDDVRRNLYGVEQQLINSAKALLRGGALSVLQRANPGLYDLLTRSLVAAKADFDIAVKNCQQVSRDFANGSNPLQGWLRAALYADWSFKTGNSRSENSTGSPPSPSIDPVIVERQSTEEPGKNGIPWVDGRRAGGTGQQPLQVATDIAEVGYRTWLGNNPEVSGNSRLKRVWPQADDASSWVREVTGETEVRFCKGCKTIDTSPGAGLQLEIVRERKRLLPLLDALINAAGRPDAELLQKLHNPGMGIGLNIEVLEALKQESPANRYILSRRITTDLALANAIEKAMMARQLLRVGRREPNVAANSQAQLETDRMLELLDKEIENVLFEQRIRREVLAETSQLMLERHRDRAADVSERTIPLPLNAGGGRPTVR